MKCGHGFHEECINRWQNNEFRMICPICRTLDFNTNPTPSKNPGNASADNSGNTSDDDSSVIIIEEDDCNDISNHVKRIEDHMDATKIGMKVQEKQAEKWKISQKEEYKITVGDFVAVKFDQRDRDTWKSAQFVEYIFKVGGNNGFGVQVASQHGVLFKNIHLKRQSIAYIPIEKYKRLPPNFPFSFELKQIKKDILKNKFDPKNMHKLSMKKA